MLNVIKRWLGITAMQSRIAELERENNDLRTGKAVVTPDGKVARAVPPSKLPFRPRAHTWHQLARNREANVWRDMCQEAYPGADASPKRPR